MLLGESPSCGAVKRIGLLADGLDSFLLRRIVGASPVPRTKSWRRHGRWYANAYMQNTCIRIGHTHHFMTHKDEPSRNKTTRAKWKYHKCREDGLLNRTNMADRARTGLLCHDSNRSAFHQINDMYYQNQTPSNRHA